MLYESLVVQCEYPTQPNGFFWCHVIDSKVPVLSLIFTNKFVLVWYLSFSFRYFLYLSFLGFKVFLGTQHDVNDRFWCVDINSRKLKVTLITGRPSYGGSYKIIVVYLFVCLSVCQFGIFLRNA